MNAHRNLHIDELETDYLYHLGLDTSMDLPAMFGDTKIVCMGGSAERAKDVAGKIAQRLNLDSELEPQPIGKTDRYSLYKTGPVLSVSHGIGMPSMLIVLHELTKLLEHAGATDVEYIRIGTSGGIGVEPGTVVVAEQALNGTLKPYFEQVVLGRKVEYPTDFDQRLAEEIHGVRGKLQVVLGKTMGTDDFYEGQGRLDGALEPMYSAQEKLTFLRTAYAQGVRNIEMEATALAAFCQRAGIPAVDVCATFLNRLQGDQVTSTPKQLAEYASHAQELVLRYIEKKVGTKK